LYGSQESNARTGISSQDHRVGRPYCTLAASGLGTHNERVLIDQPLPHARFRRLAQPKGHGGGIFGRCWPTNVASSSNTALPCYSGTDDGRVCHGRACDTHMHMAAVSFALLTSKTSLFELRCLALCHHVHALALWRVICEVCGCVVSQLIGLRYGLDAEESLGRSGFVRTLCTLGTHDVDGSSRCRLGGVWRQLLAGGKRTKRVSTQSF
jgi:hypothetical protein